MKVGTSNGQSFSHASTSHVLERMAENFAIWVFGFLSVLALENNLL